MTNPYDAQHWVEQLRKAVLGDPFWEPYLAPFFSNGDCMFGIHLAIFVEPYLGYILEGKKTVESRFSSRQCPPYERVCEGDVLLLKRTGGPIVGLCQVASVWYYKLDPSSWHLIRSEFAQAICAQDPSFWKAREAASFASLFLIGNVRVIDPVRYSKRDRRGWVILHSKTYHIEFEDVLG